MHVRNVVSGLNLERKVVSALVWESNDMTFIVKMASNSNTSIKSQILALVRDSKSLGFFSELKQYKQIYLDMSLSCPGLHDEDCAHWDHTVNLYICCDETSSLCNMELGRWITPFRR